MQRDAPMLHRILVHGSQLEYFHPWARPNPTALPPTQLHATEAQRYSLPPSLKEFRHVVSAERKPEALAALLRALGPDAPTIVFTSSLETTARLQRLLAALGEGVTRGHSVEYSGALGPDRRRLALEAFSARRARILVCSDALTRGMDVAGVAAVVNYDAPVYAKTYVHRAGRTARAGAPGAVYTLLRREEVRHFRAMLRKAEGSRVADLALDRLALAEVAPAVEAALRRLQAGVRKEGGTRRNDWHPHRDQGWPCRARPQGPMSARLGDGGGDCPGGAAARYMAWMPDVHAPVPAEFHNRCIDTPSVPKPTFTRRTWRPTAGRPARRRPARRPRARRSDAGLPRCRRWCPRPRVSRSRDGCSCPEATSSITPALAHVPVRLSFSWQRGMPGWCLLAGTDVEYSRRGVSRGRGLVFGLMAADGQEPRRACCCITIEGIFSGALPGPARAARVSQAAFGKQRAVRMVRSGCACVAAPLAQGRLRRSFNPPSSSSLPDADGAVVGAGEDMAVGGGQHTDGVAVPLALARAAPGAQVPEAQGGVVGAGHELGGGQGQCQHGLGMALQHLCVWGVGRKEEGIQRDNSTNAWQLAARRAGGPSPAASCLAAMVRGHAEL